MGNVSFQKLPAAAPVVVETKTVETPAEGVTIDVQTTHVPEPVVPATEIPSTAAVVVAAPSEVPATVATPWEFNDDAIGFEDVNLPRINLVHKVGALSEQFNPGEITLNQATVIHTPKNELKKIEGNPPLRIVILGFRPRQFAEKVGNNERGMLVSSKEDVVKNHGTLDYKEWEVSVAEAKKPGSTSVPLRYFQNLATAVLLVECPVHLAESDKDHVIFPYECAGRFYALALWGMKGTAYTHAAKDIFTARKLGHLRKGYCQHGYTLTTKVKIFGENPTVIPELGIGEKTSPQLESFIRTEIIGSAN